jgi:hypothetical protein
MNIAVTFSDKDDSLFETKIESIVKGLTPDCKKFLQRVSKKNALIIIDYIISMQTEINLSHHYQKDLIILLSRFSISSNHKPFQQITRPEIITFLDSFRKSEEIDPLHRWIGTYNLYRVHLLRFFKWLYYPEIEPVKRPKPNVVENISQLKRRSNLYTNLQISGLKMMIFYF